MLSATGRIERTIFRKLQPAHLRHLLSVIVIALVLGVSLGGVESILSYPATMSHAAMPPQERAARGISDALVRLSVGLEDAGDLIESSFNILPSASAYGYMKYVRGVRA